MPLSYYKDEIFCPQCGANLALGIEKEVAGEGSKEFVKRTLYLFCPNQNCPTQYNHLELPKA